MISRGCPAEIVMPSAPLPLNENEKVCVVQSLLGAWPGAMEEDFLFFLSPVVVSFFFLLILLIPHPSPSSAMNRGISKTEGGGLKEEEALKSMLFRMYSTTLTVTAFPRARMR